MIPSRLDKVRAGHMRNWTRLHAVLGNGSVVAIALSAGRYAGLLWFALLVAYGITVAWLLTRELFPGAQAIPFAERVAVSAGTILLVVPSAALLLLAESFVGGLVLSYPTRPGLAGGSVVVFALVHYFSSALPGVAALHHLSGKGKHRQKHALFPYPMDRRIYYEPEGWVLAWVSFAIGAPTMAVLVMGMPLVLWIG